MVYKSVAMAALPSVPPTVVATKYELFCRGRENYFFSVVAAIAATSVISPAVAVSSELSPVAVVKGSSFQIALESPTDWEGSYFQDDVHRVQLDILSLL